MLCNMEKPVRRSRGRPPVGKYWALDALIIGGSGDLFRTGRFRTPTEAIREFVSRLWAGDHQAVLAIVPAFGTDYRDAVLTDLANFRRQVVGCSKEAVVRRVLGRMEPTTYRHRGKLIAIGGPLFGAGRGLLGYGMAKALDHRRGRRRRVVE
jgi:hypothetical protein